MKKYIYGVMALALAAGFTSCEDDNDSNPTMKKATEFVLNAPEFQKQEVDLASSTMLTFTCSQPNYGFPMQCKYSLQFSLTGNFTVSVDEAADDESKTPDYQVSDETPSCSIPISAANMAKGLEQLAKWEEGLVPASVKVYVRAKAEPKAETAANVKDFIVYSNVQEFTAVPYYIELKDAPVVLWYLVGNMFGGKWGSEPGNTALPMFIIPDYAYDKKTGLGELEYTNYFITGDYEGNECGTAGFKIQPDNFNWDLGMTGDNGQKGKIIFRNKGDDGGHIVAPDNGYYTIIMNTDKKTAEMKKYEGTVGGTYSAISVIGLGGDWDNDIDMSAYNSDGVENHVWFTVINVAAPTEFKFRADHGWDNNWGSSKSPVGVGVSNGDNIPVEAGKWLVIFNDINGYYNLQAL